MPKRKSCFQKGNKLAGSRKGIPNKLTSEAKDAIQQVFDGLGGVDAMLAWARQHKTVFYSAIYPKLLPHKINADMPEEVDYEGAHQRLMKLLGCGSETTGPRLGNCSSEPPKLLEQPPGTGLRLLKLEN